MTHLALRVALLLALGGGCGDAASSDGSSGSGGSGGSSGSQGLGGGASSSTAGSSGATSTGTGGAAPGPSMLAWNLEGYPKTSRAPEVVQSVIAAQRPTIAAFVEIDDLEGLEAAIDASGDYALAIANDPPFATVIAVDTQVATILDGGELFTDDSYRFPRAPVIARVELLATGEQVEVIGLHLKAQIDEESEARRREANDRLAQWCVSRHASVGNPIVLLGDFNDELTGPASDDVYGAYRQSTTPPFVLLTEPAELAGDYTYVPFEAFIDHAIATEPFAARWPEAVASVLPLDEEVADYVRDVTDHRPIRVELEPR